MSLIDNLKFWKRKDEHFDLGQYPGLEANAPMMPQQFPQGDMQDPGQMPHLDELGPAPMPPQNFSAGRGQGIASPLSPAPSSFAPAPVQQDSSREFQVVNAKLDTLKAILDGINAKLDRMDQPKKEEVELVPLQRRWR